MIFLEALEVVVIVAVLAIFCTQIFVPIWKGTKMFPTFRRESDLLDKLTDEKQLTEEARILAEINKEKKRRTKNG